MAKLRIGELIYKTGCFTFEGYIENCQIYHIGQRLGLPNTVMQEGIYIAYALGMPESNGFELAGVTIDSTDKFVDYSTGEAKYDVEKFKKLYKGMDVSEMKDRYRNIFAEQKLVKVIPATGYQPKHYPEGTIVPQFIMTKPMLCMIGAYVPLLGTFRKGGIIGLKSETSIP